MSAPLPPIPLTPDRWQAWDNFLEAAPQAGFMQASWWADFRTHAGFGHFALILKHRGEIVGGALVQKFSYAPEACFYYVQDGPVVPEDEGAAAEVFESVLEGIEEHRRAEQLTVSHLRIEPRWPRPPSFLRGFAVPPFLANDNYVEPRNTLYIDLRPPEEAILAQMKPKGRYNIRVAQRHGVSVAEDTSEQGLADFLRIYEDTAGRQGFGEKPPEYFEELVPLLVSLRRGSLFFAEYQGQRLAAAVVVYFGRRATYFFGGSLATHRHTMAPYLLHFEIMRRAKASGHEWYDLWGIAPRDKPDDPWQDISVFKRKFGGREVNLISTLDCVYDAAAYGEYASCSEEVEVAE